VVDAALAPYNDHQRKKVEQFFTRYYNSMGPRTRNHTGYNYWNSNEFNITYVMKGNWARYLSPRKSEPGLTKMQDESFESFEHF
jgi:hypothetical protein